MDKTHKYNLKPYKLSYILPVFFAMLSLSAYAQKDTNRVNQLNDLCFENLYSNITLAKSQAFEALQLAGEIKFKKGEAGALNRIGVVYDVLGEFDTALIYYTKSLAINRQLKNKKGEGSTLCNIGLTLVNKGDYSSALANFHSAIKPLESIQHNHYLGNCYNNIGLVYIELRHHSKAKFNFFKALEYYKKAGRDYEQASVMCNLAMIMSQEFKYDSSFLINKNAIAIFEKEEDYYNLGKCYNNIGNDLLLLRKYDLAIEYYLKALDYQRKSGSYNSYGETLIYIAETYDRIGNKKESEKYVNEAFEISHKIRSPKIVSNVFYHYAVIKMRFGDYKTAAIYLRKVKNIRDSLFRDETSKLIASTEAKFGVERKESENKQLAQKNKIQELRIKNAAAELKLRNQLSFGVIALAVLFFIGGLMYIRRRQFLQKLEANNQIKDAEHQQRIAISHDLHDNVGAQLSYIVSNLDVIQTLVPDNNRLKSVTEMSKQAILTLRETVWALNNETVTTEAFADKFKQYALKMLDFNSDFKCEFSENIQHSKVLNPLQALNLFRICQEAFSNAIKHSGGTQLQIQFYNDEKSIFNFRLKDNGHGFDTEEGKNKGHYGLLNMESRAAEVGAEYHLHTVKGEGTTVSVHLKST